MNNIDRGTLGRQLQMVRGLYWGYGCNGDPYTMLLCGNDDDPWRWYRALRERGIWRSRTETWVVADHASALRVLDDPGFTRAVGRTPDWMRGAGCPPEQWAQPFRDVHAASWDGEVPAPGELAEHFAGRLPGPGERLDLVRDHAWPVALLGITATPGLTGSEARTLHSGAWNARSCLDAQLSPQRLAETEAAIGALPEEESLRALFAGAAMAATTVVNAVLSIHDTPGLADRLADDPAVAERIVAEVLRLTPAAHLERRVATTAKRLGDKEISEGDEVIVLIATANRDAGVFTDPDRLDPDRTDAGHRISAQRGRPGRLDELVSALATAALTASAKLLPGLRVTGPVIRRRRSPVLRGTDRCPVDL